MKDLKASLTSTEIIAQADMRRRNNISLIISAFCFIKSLQKELRINGLLCLRMRVCTYACVIVKITEPLIAMTLTFLYSKPR